MAYLIPYTLPLIVALIVNAVNYIMFPAFVNLLLV
jgi:hypothetical protein